MVAAVTATLSQLGAVVVGTRPATEADISQLQVIVLYTAPAVTAYISQIQAIVLADNPTLDVRISQLQAIVVYVGAIANPKIRVWTYSLDDHDYYVEALGDGDTLVYDTFSKQWSVWGNAQTRHWCAVYGLNWIGAGTNRLNFGSDVVCGDDQNGAIYFLDPRYPYDDDREDGALNPLAFECQVTGQVIVERDDRLPFGIVKLFGSFGDTYDDTLTAVSLEYSDDAGRNYVSAGTLDVTPGDYAARVEWRSLGSAIAPGRLFRITDAGAVTRVDGLQIVDGKDA